EHTGLLESRKIDTAGLQIVTGGKTFRWHGKYRPNMNDRDTLNVHLNVLDTFDPLLPDHFKSTKLVFLGNIKPAVQLRVIEQLPPGAFKVADTMDLWIEIARDDLLEVLKRLDGVVLNDSEAKMLTGEENVITAGHKVRALGPKFVVVKKGEHGAIFLSEHGTFVLPAFPTERVVDPTGAGDTFAGGMMGYIATLDKLDPTELKKALGYGVVVASYTVEGFGLDRLREIEKADIDKRLAEYQQMLSF
ncbi:MAG TPA: PfkB family carbohydrate kinase, partial [Pirellulales bacterium]